MSPGVSVTIIDESFYQSSGQGTVPLIVFATASNKASPSGTGNAPGTAPAQAGRLYLATSQRDLIQSFGNPIFYNTQGTSLHGYECNEFGLWTAYSYLGISNQCYVLRADVDLGQLIPSVSPPVGPPVAGTYWFDLVDTRWGVFRANGSTSPGAAWHLVTVKVAMAGNLNGDVPMSSYGNDRDIAVVPTTPSNFLYEKINGTWCQIGTSEWAMAHPTTLTGSATSGTLNQGDAFSINDVNVTISVSAASFNDVANDINNATIPDIFASTATSGALVITNTNGGAITVHDLVGTPLATIGMTVNEFTGSIAGTILTVTDVASGNLKLGQYVTGAGTAGGTKIVAFGSGVGGMGTYSVSISQTVPGGTMWGSNAEGVTVTRNSNATYPDGHVANSIWVKGNPSNNGAQWIVKYYNGQVGQWIVMTAPFFQFDSTLMDGDPNKDAAALKGLVTPAVGNVYVGYDVATGDQQLRRWSGAEWQSLVYEAEVEAPSTPPADGVYWYDTNVRADIMYGNGEYWIGYHHQFPSTDPNGPQIAGSPPLTQSDGINALAEGDLWIDSTDLEHYPMVYRWDSIDQQWFLIDNTDHTTPFGIIFADARSDSGPTFTGIHNSGDYAFGSTAAQDMALSDYVEPDVPDPRFYPAGMLLFNTRYSTYNVKVWRPHYFNAGGFDPNTDFTNTSYSVGGSNYIFPPLDDAGKWVTASGNQANGAAYMGRKAQRAMVVRALAAAVNSNQDIRSEIVFFNLMSAPGYPELIPEFVTLNADMMHTSFCVADTPIRLPSDGTSLQNWAQNVNNVPSDGEDGLVTADQYTGIYYPWGLSTNLDGMEIMVPPSAIALVTIAYNDLVAYPWMAPAGFNRGLVTNATSVGYLDHDGSYIPTILNQGQRDVLYLNRVNPIAYIPNRGLVVYGQKTLSPTTTAMDRINVARLINYIAYHLDNLLKPFLFESNVASTRATAKSTCERFFNRLVGLSGLYDYAVVCDLSNNTPDRIDANELWIDCAIQPVKTVEFIYVPVRILATQPATG